MYNHTGGKINGTPHFEGRHILCRQRRGCPRKWNEIPNRGGQTLIDGTAYEVGFGPDGYEIKYFGTSAVAAVKHNGSTYNDYYNPNGSFIAQPGDLITVWATDGAYDSNGGKTKIYKNGALVAKSKKETEMTAGATYTFAAEADTTITFNGYYYNDNRNKLYYAVDIVTG